MEYFQDIDWQQLKDEEGRSIDDLLKDEHFEVEIFNDNVYTAYGGAVKVGKKSIKDMLEFIEAIT